MKIGMYYTDILILLADLTLISTDDILSYNKIATQSLTYASPSSGARNAVDGNTATCTKQMDIGSNTQYKTVWWKVDLGDVFNIYSISILFRTYDGYEYRQRGRLAGFSLYVSTTGDIQGSTLCYKDGPQLPPLKFTTTCIQHGRYVIFYNERKDEITYPMDYQITNLFNELCEVVVLGCNKTGVYGMDCNKLCPINCQNNLCNIENGSCFGCKPGWRDILCDRECIEGRYGSKCLQQCSGHCRDSVTCNYVTGQCDRGCDKGWTGALCDKGCDDGTYGYNCVNNCSGHCLNNSPCNKQTGHCDTGCKPGYTYTDCSKECTSGHYGLDCMDTCSGHCINNEPCDHISGVCPSGCQDGYTGALCTDACAERYFGANCSRKCSPHCKPDTCQHADGSCTCTAGWMGKNCTTECMLSFGDNCQYMCDVHCINQTCDRINGSCLYGCTEGEQCYGSVDTANNAQQLIASSDKLPVIVGGTVGTCVIVIIGVVLALFVISSVSSSNNLPITVGIVMSTCILVIIGVVITILLLRQRSSRTMSNTSVRRVCFKSATGAEESVNSENLSNYQELNFALQENPYQSMSR